MDGLPIGLLVGKKLKNNIADTVIFHSTVFSAHVHCLLYINDASLCHRRSQDFLWGCTVTSARSGAPDRWWE